MAIKHAREVTDPANPEVGADDWNGDHTIDDGTLSIAKTNGLQAALDGKQPLATVLTNTTASFTTAQESKLAGIEAGAEVNVNADWDAVSGDAQILNKPTIPSISGLVPYTGANADVDLGENSLTTQDMTLPTSATVTPTTPAANNVTIFGRNIAGKAVPAFIGSSGLDTALQPHVGRNKVSLVSAAGNGSTLTIVGALANSATGTATTESVALTTNYTKFKRLAYYAAAAATNAVAGFRNAALQYWNEKGYHVIVQWGISEGVTGNTSSRAFCGMRASTAAPTDVEPSSLTNIIGMGWDGADTNIQIMHNDGSGTATKIDLGASFSKPTVNATNVYELALFARPNGDVDYEVRELLTSNVATGTISTDKPSQTQLMTIMGYTSAGGTNSVRSKFGFVQYFIETDY